MGPVYNRRQGDLLLNWHSRSISIYPYPAADLLDSLLGTSSPRRNRNEDSKPGARQRLILQALDEVERILNDEHEHDGKIDEVP